jgi:hypothetical protein
MRAGVEFPPVAVFWDGQIAWLADGLHCVEAAKRAGLNDIEVRVFEGGEWDAVLHAVGSNTPHGLRRSNADKRKVVSLLLSER